MRVAFTPDGWRDYVHWIGNDAKISATVTRLIEDVRRTPFVGLGKPEPLKRELSGWWSRRITAEHRLVYRVEGRGDDQRSTVAQCRHHY